MLKAYNGDKSYVFVSYSHKDWAMVSVIIKKLQENLCHVWFDEGIKSGSVWNEDLAEHLLHAEIMLLLLSEASVESEFVRSEINFARNHNIKILPVYLESVILPIGLEFQLSTIQAIQLHNPNDKEVFKKLQDSLPDEVFLHTETPFYIDSEYSFYLKQKETMVKAMLQDKDVLGFQISRKKKDDSRAEEVLFRFFPTAAYDKAQYTITLCQKINDTYFNEKENGMIVFNVNAKFFLSYPLVGPDFCALLTFVIVNPNGEDAEVKLVDCKISTTNHDYTMNMDLDTLKKELWGSGTEISMIQRELD